MNVHKIIQWIGAGMALLSATACEHKELCYDHPHTATLHVEFDWQQAPDATPSLMEVYFFPRSGGQPQRFAFHHTGGEVDLLPGTYDALCLNTGGSANRYRGTDTWSTFEVYTRDASLLEGMDVLVTAEPPRPSGTEGQSGGLEPDSLWTACREELTVDVSAGKQTLVFTPRQVHTNFTFRITGAENLTHVKAISGSLSGLSRGYFVGTETYNEETVCVPFAARHDNSSEVTGSFRGFCPDRTASGLPHKFVIYILLDDGSSWYYTYDVTDQVNHAPDPRNIHLELDGLPLPAPVTDEGGMNAGVDGWDNVEVDLPM